jgi:hypothetical protein
MICVSGVIDAALGGLPARRAAAQFRIGLIARDSRKASLPMSCSGTYVLLRKGGLEERAAL